MKDNWRDYYHKGLAAFLTIAMSILFFFMVFRFRELRIYVGLILNILRPFAFGAVIAYLLSPLCNWIERWGGKALQLENKPSYKQEKYKKMLSGAGIVISLLLFCLIIYGLIAMVGAQVIDSIRLLIEAMPEYIQRMSSWLEQMVADNEVILNYVEQYSKDITEYVQDFAKGLVPNINNIINGVSISLWTTVSVAKDLIIGLIVAVYLMNSRKIFARQAKIVVHAVFPVKKDLPPDRKQTAEWILYEANVLNNYLGGFVKGKLLDSLIIGLICMVFTSIMKMPYAMLISVVIGVTNIIPFFGPFFGAVPTAILILMVSPVKCVYFIIFILVLQQFDGNILGPKILGNSTNLGSFWVLFAILLFGGLFGIVGMVIGVPVFAFIYQLAQEWVRKRIKTQRDGEKKEKEAAT
ncbi:MAG TPA: AI-2E family transporter [Lachnospiraceae bacterium]|nr:AI-2E family transporter [Lachnospiraceae bacterium]